MYAITFDMITEQLEKLYPSPSYQNAYAEIRKSLGKFGFTNKQGSVYFGNEGVDAVTTVLAVQELARNYPWFAPSVRDIRMLRIEDNNDLLPAVEKVVELSKGNKP